MNHRLKDIVIPEVIEPVGQSISFSLKYSENFIKKYGSRIKKIVCASYSDGRKDSLNRHVQLPISAKGFALADEMLRDIPLKAGTSIEMHFRHDFLPTFSGAIHYWHVPEFVRLPTVLPIQNLGEWIYQAWQIRVQNWWVEKGRATALDWKKNNEAYRAKLISGAANELQATIKAAVLRAYELEMSPEEIKLTLELALIEAAQAMSRH